MDRIVIIAMASWGELGNMLAAEALKNCLGGVDDLEVKVIKMEEVVPVFAEYGASIKQIVLQGRTSAEVHERYMSYMQFLETMFLDIEIDLPTSSPLHMMIKMVARYLDDQKANLFIGTKGIISRILLAACKLGGLRVPVVNYVTNEGLLTIALHRSLVFQHTLVPFETGREYLLDRCGYASESVRVVGRLIPASAGDISLCGEDIPRDEGFAPRILIFSNRGGEQYIEILRSLVERAEDNKVIFVTYNDPKLVQKAREFVAMHPKEGWQVVEQLTQAAYLGLIRWLSTASTPLLITKTGPNTMLEAAFNGIPQLLLNSGLPMEQWVTPFVRAHSFGGGFDTVQELIPCLNLLLDHPDKIRSMKSAAIRFSNDVLNQRNIRATICDAVGRLL